MSSQLGWRVTGPSSTLQRQPLVTWVHQPPSTGGVPKPMADDSALVTVQVMPAVLGTLNEGVYISEAWLEVEWNAAGGGQMAGEVDLFPGAIFSLAATSVHVYYRSAMSVESPGVTFEINSTLGRLPRPSGTEGPTRTRYYGTINNFATSSNQTIPKWAKTIKIVTATGGAGFTANVIQSFNGVVVQIDSVSPINPFVSVNALASNVAIENTSFAARNIMAVYRLAL